MLIGVSAENPTNTLSYEGMMVLLGVTGVDITSLGFGGKFVFVAQVGSPLKTVYKLRDVFTAPDGIGMDVLITGL